MMNTPYTIRTPRWPALILLPVGAALVWFALEMKYLHHLRFTDNVVRHPWIVWPILGIGLLALGAAIKTALAPITLLVADAGGITLAFPKAPLAGVRTRTIPWRQVVAVEAGEMSITRGSGSRLRTVRVPALAFTFTDDIDLSGWTFQGMGTPDWNNHVLLVEHGLLPHGLPRAVQILAELAHTYNGRR